MKGIRLPFASWIFLRVVAAISLTLIAVLPSLYSPACEAATARVVDEPIFGLFYNPKSAHFQTIPTAKLLPTCKKALTEYDPLPAAFVLYARYVTASSRIYIIGADDGLGIYYIHAGDCDVGVPMLSLIHRQHSPGAAVGGPALSDAEIAGLFSDALNRYSKAFGGKEKFLQWLDETTKYMLAGSDKQPPSSLPPTYHLLLPAQQQQLEKYRGS